MKTADLQCDSGCHLDEVEESGTIIGLRLGPFRAKLSDHIPIVVVVEWKVWSCPLNAAQVSPYHDNSRPRLYRNVTNQQDLAEDEESEDFTQDTKPAWS